MLRGPRTGIEGGGVDDGRGQVVCAVPAPRHERLQDSRIRVGQLAASRAGRERCGPWRRRVLVALPKIVQRQYALRVVRCRAPSIGSDMRPMTCLSGSPSAQGLLCWRCRVPMVSSNFVCRGSTFSHLERPTLAPVWIVERDDLAAGWRSGSRGEAHEKPALASLAYCLSEVGGAEGDALSWPTGRRIASLDHSLPCAADSSAGTSGAQDRDAYDDSAPEARSMIFGRHSSLACFRPAVEAGSRRSGGDTTTGTHESRSEAESAWPSSRLED